MEGTSAVSEAPMSFISVYAILEFIRPSLTLLILPPFQITNPFLKCILGVRFLT